MSDAGLKHFARLDGVRGGKDRFSWEEVKNDKYREFYLGHSLKAPIGIRSRGVDSSWYAKPSKVNKISSLEAIKKEKQAIKEVEEQQMRLALSGIPDILSLTPLLGQQRHFQITQASGYEIKGALKKASTADKDPFTFQSANRVAGLGYLPSRRIKLPDDIVKKNEEKKVKRKRSRSPDRKNKK